MKELVPLSFPQDHLSPFDPKEKTALLGDPLIEPRSLQGFFETVRQVCVSADEPDRARRKIGNLHFRDERLGR